jgi:hypothetical protein
MKNSKTETSHTPTQYRIGKIMGIDTWTVGKVNSLTRVFHFKYLADAISKHRELTKEAITQAEGK